MPVNSKSRYQPSDITLYIPYYNASNTIDDCLEGILKQTIKPHRICVIDDGSTIPYENLDVEVVRHPVNMGLAAGRNTAVNACDTSLIAALDSDVLPDPGWLEQLLSVMNGENCVGAGGMMTERYSESLADRWRSVHMAQHWGDDLVKNPRFLYGANTLFKTDSLRAAGLYDKRCRSNDEDRILAEALYAEGCDLIYTPDARCEHLRQDTVGTILQGYWRWHHTKGLLGGAFDAAAGVTARIESVNFGIFKYRFDLDRVAGRSELLPLDMMIPWVFCAMDLAMFGRHTGTRVPCFPELGMWTKIPDSIIMMLKSVLPELGVGSLNESWVSRYYAEFQRNLDASGWMGKANDLILLDEALQA